MAYDELRIASDDEPLLRPVRRVPEQVADQLRSLISRGVLKPGDRLPTEATLAKEFGVSRGSVREALRMLSGQRLIRTVKGSTGGSFVTLPTVDHVSEFIESTLALLAEAETLSLEQLLEARELIEVPAARLAARRRTAQVQRLEAAIPPAPLTLPAQQQFAYNKQFHVAVMEETGNVLLRIAVEPIFSILQTRLSRSVLKASFHRTINVHHREITAALAAGDQGAAGDLMQAHLHYLRPAYERAWRSANLRAGGRVP